MLKKRLLKIAFLVLFACLLLPLQAGAAQKYGVMPGVRYIDFEPGLTVEESFTLISRESSDSMDFELSIEKGRESQVYTGVWEDLGGFVSLGEKSISLQANEIRDVFFTVEMPSDLRPGKHRASIQVSPVTGKGGESTVGTAVSTIFQLFVAVPFPGKYAEIRSVSAVGTEPGKTVKFSVLLWNLGTETINSAKAIVEVSTLENKRLKTVVSDLVQNIEPAKLKKIVAPLDVSDFEPGVYNAKVRVQYDGKETERVDLDFRVGQLLLEVAGIKQEFLRAGEINKIEFFVDSKWNRGIKNVSAEIFLIDQNGNTVASGEMPLFDVAAWERLEVSGFLDLRGAEEGYYTIRIVLGYQNTSTEFEQEMQVKKTAAFAFNIGAIDWGGLGLLAFAAVFVAFLFVSRKRIVEVQRRAAQRLVLLLKRPAKYNVFIELSELNARIGSLNKTVELLENAGQFFSQRETKLKSGLMKLQEEKEKKGEKKKGKVKGKRKAKARKKMEEIEKEIAIIQRQKLLLGGAVTVLKGTVSYLEGIKKQLEERAREEFKKEKEDGEMQALLVEEKEIVGRVKHLEGLRKKGELSSESFDRISLNLRMELDAARDKIRARAELKRVEKEKELLKEIKEKERALEKEIKEEELGALEEEREAEKMEEKPTEKEIKKKLAKAQEMLLEEKIDQETYKELKQQLEEELIEVKWKTGEREKPAGKEGPEPVEKAAGEKPKKKGFVERIFGNREEKKERKRIEEMEKKIGILEGELEKRKKEELKEERAGETIEGEIERIEEELEEKGIFKCRKCGREFKSRIALLGHMKSHRKKFKCKECGKTFDKKIALTGHMQSHKKKKKK